jgi:hypothetical protein
MPNWCNNSVFFRHDDPAQIDRLIEAFNAERLFTEFVPCPPALKAETPIGEDYNERVAAKEAANLAEYGHKDWYSWSMENWGTKWDASTGEWNDADRTNENQVGLSFDTAWQPPVVFYEKMTELGFKVDAFYLEEGQGFVGKYTSTDGDESFNFDGSEDLEDIPDDIREFWDLDTICEWRDADDEPAEEEEEDTAG